MLCKYHQFSETIATNLLLSYRKTGLFCHPIYIYFLSLYLLLFEVGILGPIDISVINEGDCVRYLHTWHLGFINTGLQIGA